MSEAIELTAIIADSPHLDKCGMLICRAPYVSGKYWQEYFLLRGNGYRLLLFPLRLKYTEKALAIALPPWYSIDKRAADERLPPGNLIRLLRQALEGFWTE